MKLVFTMIDIFKILREQQSKFAPFVPEDADLGCNKKDVEFVFEWEEKDDD
jgi:hypothetical protein